MDLDAPAAEHLLAAAPTMQPPGDVDSDGPPDWSKIEDDIDCPLCGYLLRGLIEPRCPECGYRFEWAALLAARAGRHPYLFEHHPERNWWSYWRTFVGALRPARFWSGLHPAQRQDARRLLIYAAVPYALTLLIWIPLFVVDVRLKLSDLTTWTASMRAQQRAYIDAHSKEVWVQSLVTQYGSIAAYLDAVLPRVTVGGALVTAFIEGPFGFGMLVGVICGALWPAASLGALLIFQVSMRRARLRTIHIARCVVYSFDLLAWLIPVLVVAAGILRPFGVHMIGTAWLENALSTVIAVRYGAAANQAAPPQWAGAAASPFLSALASAAADCALTMACLFGIARLAIAYKRYLNLHAPIAVVVASQVIVLLTAMVLLAQAIMT